MVAPISAPMLQMVPFPVQLMDVAPSPKYSTTASVPPLTVRIPEAEISAVALPASFSAVLASAFTSSPVIETVKFSSEPPIFCFSFLVKNISIDALGNILIYDPEYNSNKNPVYYESPNIIVPNPYANDIKNNILLIPKGSSNPAYQS